MGSGCDPPLQKARKRLRAEPCPDHLHNKGIPRRGLTLPPRPPCCSAPPPHFPPRPPKPPGPGWVSTPGPRRPQSAWEDAPPALSPSSPGTSGARPSPSRRPAAETLTRRRTPPGPCAALPSGPFTPQVPARRRPSEPSANPSPHSGCRTRPNPPSGPSRPALPHPQPGWRFPAHPRTPSPPERQAQARGTPGDTHRGTRPPPTPRPTDPARLVPGQHMPTRRSPSPAPQGSSSRTPRP